MDKKLNQLAQMLLLRSADRSMNWEASEPDDAYAGYWLNLNGGKVFLSHTLDDQGEDFYTFAVVGADGKPVTHAAQWHGPGYALLADLFAQVDRRMRKVDETLDALLTELGAKPEDLFADDL